MQIVGEIDYSIGPDLQLTAGATFSQYFRFFEVGDSFVDRLQNALAGFGGPGCPYADPARRAGLGSAQLAAIAGTGGCTWFNPFSTAIERNQVTGEINPDYAGAGTALVLDATPGAGLVNSPDTFGDFYQVWGRTARTRQAVGELVLAGGSGVRLPGGEMRFALGAQVRRDWYSRTYEGGNNLDLFSCPGSVLNQAASCDPEAGALGFIGAGRNVRVSSDVGALFAELQIPLTARLSAQLAARLEDYGGSVGSTFDPQARLRFELADWLTLRAGIGTTFRSPPPQNTSADLVLLTFIGGAFRAVDLFGNAELQPESATTYSAGAIIDRGGFRASLDYWRYDLEGAIESEPVSGIVAALFGASGNAHCGDPAFAALEARFTFSGDTCGAANVQRLATYAFNSADITTSGLDIQAGYDWSVSGAQLQFGVSGSYVIEYAIDQTLVEGVLVQPAYDAAGLLNYQSTAYPLPQVKGQAWVQALIGGHSLRLQANHVGSYRDQRAELFTPNTGALAGAVVSRGERIGAFTTLDATWRWSIEGGTTLAVTLANLLDEDAPFARLDQNFDPFTADALGFTAKIGVNQEF